MKRTFLMLLLSLCLGGAVALEHPSLLLTRKGVTEIRNNRGKVEAFDRSLAATFAGAERALSLPIVVPLPKDGGGG